MTTLVISHPACLEHNNPPGHPERPDRLRAIEQVLGQERFQFLSRDEAPRASFETIALCHSEHEIAEIRHRAPKEGFAYIDADTSMSPGSLEAMLRSAGGALAATDAVMTGAAQNAFVATRPPGHHAESQRPMGFCFFNNVAIAARHALDGHGLQRVAIIDFDVHHGNGTEAAFSGDSRVLMCSIFQHPFYPFTGADNQAPNMCNVPMPARSKGMAVREAVDLLWLPRLHDFKPEMLFISAGFDAHREDDLGNMGLVEDDYAWITDQMREIAKRYAHGRIVSCLEGGYNLSALGRSVVAHVRSLAGI
jgi:acetoin utilization deacetylase AcuC-like enzyme